ncbi:hypothetical protein ACF087_32375 [Streptomyces goshikiensis]|uniref:hypothetical protein n=1 Tax=Streptomyces goshikiensis TaxID=1942 RepID=UPI0037020F57
MAASIFASTDRPYGTPDPKNAYAAEIAELIELVEQTLRHPSLPDSPDRHVELLEAPLAFEGVGLRRTGIYSAPDTGPAPASAPSSKRSRRPGPDLSRPLPALPSP